MMPLPFLFVRPQAGTNAPDLGNVGVTGDAGIGTAMPSGLSSPAGLPFLRLGLISGDNTGGLGNASLGSSGSSGNPGGPLPSIQLAAATDPLTGYATYYNLPGKTASGEPFDPNSNNAAMYRPGVVHMGDRMKVQLQKDPSASIDVTINDSGPFARGPDNKALLPLRPDPNIIIDLTPQAFEALTGSRKAGKVPVIVTPQPPGS